MAATVHRIEEDSNRIYASLFVGTHFNSSSHNITIHSSVEKYNNLLLHGLNGIHVKNFFTPINSGLRKTLLRGVVLLLLSRTNTKFQGRFKTLTDWWPGHIAVTAVTIETTTEQSG